MKIKSDIRAGMTPAECKQQRDFWKGKVQAGKCDVAAPGPWNPGGGFVGGSWVKDRSGECA